MGYIFSLFLFSCSYFLGTFALEGGGKWGVELFY